MKRLHLSVSIALASFAALGAFLLWGSPSRSARPVAGVTCDLRWPAGTRYAYDVEWRGEQQTRMFGAGKEAMSGSVDIAGRLELESLGERGGATVLAARMGPLERGNLQVLGQQAIPDAEALFAGRAAYVELEPGGAIRSLQFRPEDPPQFKSIMQFLLTQAQVALPSARGLRGEAHWEREEAGPFGISRVAYEVRSADPVALHRTRVSYLKLDAVPGGAKTDAVELEGGADVELAPEGHLRSLVLEERVRVPVAGAEPALDARVSVRWTLRSMKRGEAARESAGLEGLEARAPGDVVVSADARRRALAGRVDGLTREALIDAMAHATSGDLPDAKRFMWRATGLLRLHPEHCRGLADPFEAAPAPGKALILDLLTSTGHEEAQRVMRELLGSNAVRASPDFPMLLQRASLLGRPTVESADFVAEVYREARGHAESADLRHAGAMTLGAMIRALPQDGDATGVADELHEVLREDLAHAKGNDQEYLLRALGNAGRADDVPVVLEAARSSSVDVRYASALALRHTDTAEATGALVSLLSDANSAVQSAALVALSEHSLPAPQLEAIRAAVASGSLNAVNAAQLAGILSQSAGQPEARAALEALAARADVDARLRAQIRQVLVDAAG